MSTPRWILWAKALVQEVFFFLFSFCVLCPLNVFSLRKKRKGPLVIFVHGYMAPSWIWIRFFRFFEKHSSFSLLCLKMGAFFQSIDIYIEKLSQKVPQDQKVFLVGHSMGGLVCLEYAFEHPDKVQAVITLGSPLRGTYAAFMGFGQCAKQMRPDHPWMQAFTQHYAKSKNQTIHHFISLTDQIIIPNERAYPKEALHPVYTIEGRGHLGLIFQKDLIGKVLQLCQDTKNHTDNF